MRSNVFAIDIIHTKVELINVPCKLCAERLVLRKLAKA